jgi:hypothetical protein
MAQYLCGYDADTLLDISHRHYVALCESKGHTYNENDTTKYHYPIHKHPRNDSYMLTIDDATLLDSQYVDCLIDYTSAEANGWFEIISDDVDI